MKNIEFNFNEDMRLIRELMGLSQAEFAEMLHVEAVTVNRWENGSAGFSNDSLERLYMSAYRHGININKIKEQFFAEESDPIEKLLFHGAKTMIDGNLDIDHAKERNDFGKGFYCGESFVQASLFVSGFPQSSVYIFEFDPEGLEHKRYEVDREWLLTIAAFRERLGRYSGNKLIGRLKEEANSADLFQTVTLASIVEREYRVEDEAPLIASVFKNRLRRNIGLYSCATVEYILTEIEGRPHPDRILIEDTKIDNPYNTYKWAGLPPGPISNPGMVALRASSDTPKTNYYFFQIVDPAEGRHVFTTSFEEHIESHSLYTKKSGK